jgi:hypothetical protein
VSIGFVFLFEHLLCIKCKSKNQNKTCSGQQMKGSLRKA